MRTHYPWLADEDAASPSPFADPASHVLGRAAHACAAYLAGSGVALPAPDIEALADLLALHAQASSQSSHHPAACLFLFKPLLRQTMLPDCSVPARKPEAVPAIAVSAYLAVESRLDMLAAELFAAYIRSRERVHALRLAQKERAVSGLRRWASSRGFTSADSDDTGPDEAAASRADASLRSHGRRDATS